MYITSRISLREGVNGFVAKVYKNRDEEGMSKLAWRHLWTSSYRMNELRTLMYGICWSGWCGNGNGSCSDPMQTVRSDKADRILIGDGESFVGFVGWTGCKENDIAFFCKRIWQPSISVEWLCLTINFSQVEEQHCFK